MPIFKDFNDERDLLQRMGWTDDQIKNWSVDENDKVVPRTQHNEYVTGAAQFARHAPGALAGLLAGTGITAASAGKMPGPAAFGAGLVGGMVAGSAADAGVGAMLPKSWEHYLQEGQFQNPSSAFTGQLGSALVGFKFSPTIMGAAIKGLPRILSRLGPKAAIDPGVEAAKHLIGRTAIGAAMPYGSAALHEAFSPSSEQPYPMRVVGDVGLKDVLGSAGAMAIANRPTATLTKLLPKWFPDTLPDIQRFNRGEAIAAPARRGETEQNLKYAPADEAATPTPEPSGSTVTEVTPTEMTPAPKYGPDNPFLRTTPKHRSYKGVVKTEDVYVMPDRDIINLAQKVGIPVKPGQSVEGLRTELADMFETGREQLGPTPEPSVSKELVVEGAVPYPLKPGVRIEDLPAAAQAQLTPETVPAKGDEGTLGLDPEAAARMEGKPPTTQALESLEPTMQKRQITGKGEVPVKVEGLPIERSGYKDFQPTSEEPVPPPKPERPFNAPVTPADKGIMGTFLELARRKGITAEGQNKPLEVPGEDVRGGQPGELYEMAGEYSTVPHNIRLSAAAAETGPHELLHPIIKNVLSRLSLSRQQRLMKLFEKEMAQGLSLEEAMATVGGRDVVRRIGEKDFGAFQSIMSAMKERLGVHTQHDVMRLLGDVAVSGSQVPRPPLPGQAGKIKPYATHLGPRGTGVGVAENQPQGPRDSELIKQLKNDLKKLGEMQGHLDDQINEEMDAKLAEIRGKGLLGQAAVDEMNRYLKTSDIASRVGDLVARRKLIEHRLDRAEIGEAPDYQPLGPAEGPKEEGGGGTGRLPFGTKEHIDSLTKRMAEIDRELGRHTEDVKYPGYKEFYNAHLRAAAENARPSTDPVVVQKKFMEAVKDNPYHQRREELMNRRTLMLHDLGRSRVEKKLSELYGRPPVEPQDRNFQLISKVDEKDPRVLAAKDLMRQQPSLKTSDIEQHAGVFQKEDKLWREFLGGPPEEMFAGRAAKEGDTVRSFVTKEGMKAFNRLDPKVRDALLNTKVKHVEGPDSGTVDGDYIELGVEGHTREEIANSINHEVQHKLQYEQGLTTGVPFEGNLTEDQLDIASRSAEKEWRKLHGNVAYSGANAKGENILVPEFRRIYDAELAKLNPEFAKYMGALGEREARMAGGGPRNADYQILSKVDENDPRVTKAKAVQKQYPNARAAQLYKVAGVFPKEDGSWLTFVGKPGTKLFDPGQMVNPFTFEIQEGKLPNVLTKEGKVEFGMLPKETQDYLKTVKVVADQGGGGNKYDSIGRKLIMSEPDEEAFRHEFTHAVQHAQGRGSVKDTYKDISEAGHAKLIEHGKAYIKRYAKDNFGVDDISKLTPAQMEVIKHVGEAEMQRLSPEYKAYRNQLVEREAFEAMKDKPGADYQIIKRVPKEDRVLEGGRNIDYQPLNKLKGEVDKIPDPVIREGVRKAFEQRPLTAGKFIKITRPLKEMDPDVVERVAKLHNEALHGHGGVPALTGEELEVSNILKKYATETEAGLTGVGLPGRPGADLHVPNILSPDAIDTINQGGPNADALGAALEAEFIRNGATAVKAKSKVNTLRRRNTLHRDQELGLPDDVTLPDGRTIKVRDPLPYDRYSRLTASDIEWKRNVLDPTKATHTAIELQDSPHMRTSQRSYYGEYDKGGGLFKAYNRLAGAGFLQAWTGLKDFATTVPSARREGFGYHEIAKGLLNIVEGRKSAIDKELIREEPYMIGANPRTGTRHERWVNNAADTLYKLSGRKMSDDWARAWAQGIADQQGRPEAAQYIAGIYDARELPRQMLEPGLLGEAFRINRWSVSTANRLAKAAMEPSGKGAIKVGEAFLLALGVGSGFDYLRKKWTGLVKSRPELRDLRAANASPKHYVAWMADLLQKGSFAGMYGDIINGLVQSYVRGDTSKMEAFIPLVNSVKSSFEKFFDTTRAALDHGQDPMKAISAGVNDATKDLIQNYRMIHDKFMLTTEEKQRRAEGRDLNIFRELTQDQRPGTYEAPNIAEGTAEREFKKEMDPEKAMAQLDKIVTRYSAEYGNRPDRLVKKLKALQRNKTSIPADMIELMDYYEFLSNRDGPKVAEDRIMDLYQRQSLNQMKSEVVPAP